MPNARWLGVRACFEETCTDKEAKVSSLPTSTSSPIDSGAMESDMFAKWNAAHRGELYLHDLLRELDDYVGPLPLWLLTRTLARLVVTAKDVREFICFDEASYQSNRICLRRHYEARMACWLPEQLSMIHDHGDSSCAVAVLAGEATEMSFRWHLDGSLRMDSLQRVSAGGLLSSIGSSVHQVANWGRPARRLVTLNLYSPPMHTMQTYPPSRVTPVSAAGVSGLRGFARRPKGKLMRDCA